VDLSPARTGRNENSEEERSGGVELSKLDVSIDLELADLSTMSIPRTKSPSPPPPTMFHSH
jgi:hypothetical protein